MHAGLQAVSQNLKAGMHFNVYDPIRFKLIMIISWVYDQNGVSQARYLVEIHHSGWKPSICNFELNILMLLLMTWTLI